MCLYVCAAMRCSGNYSSQIRWNIFVTDRMPVETWKTDMLGEILKWGAEVLPRTHSQGTQD